MEKNTRIYQKQRYVAFNLQKLHRGESLSLIYRINYLQEQFYVMFDIASFGVQIQE